MLKRSSTARRRAICLLTALISLAATPAMRAAVPEACASPRLLSPDSVERQVDGRVGDAHCYRLDLLAGGVWHLSLASSRADASRARFDVLDAGGRPASLETFERSAMERLTHVPPGTWLVYVRAEDPLRPLPAYRLASRFVEAAWKSEEDGELEIEEEGLRAGYGPIPRKSEEDGELEIEEEGLRAGCDVGAGKSEEDGELEIEEEGLRARDRFRLKSEEDGELEIEEEGLRAGRDGAARLRQALCRPDDADDHGDSLLCATAIRGGALGELQNGWGDDVDVFGFRLDRWQTVEIATCGGLGMFGELSTDNGQRLDRAGGDGDDFRLVRSLGPGIYYVKVAGESAGGYGLAIRVLDR